MTTEGRAEVVAAWRAALPSPRYKDSLALDRELRRAAGSQDTGEVRRLRVVLGGNANLDFVAPTLRLQLAAEGFDAELVSSAFGSWIADALEGRIDGDVWVIWLASMGASRGGTARPDVGVAAIHAAIERLCQGGSRVIVIPPEPLVAEDDPYSPFRAWRETLALDVVAAAGPRAVVLPVDHIQRRVGSDAWSAPRYWEQAKAPCHPDAAVLVGIEIGVVLSRLFRPAIRAVAVDLDDTMWGGLVGEVGPEGLILDPDGQGRAFLELQQFLADLSARGIAVGVVSKNDPVQAQRPFQERPEMVLSLEDLVFFCASWEPKHIALRQFATQLNIGIDALCFLDDSALERDEASRMLPGLVVPELASAPEHRVRDLNRSLLFINPSITTEDRARVEFYKKQGEEPPAYDLDTYLAGLDMTLTPIPIGSTSLDRAVSLLHKTNQFNLTMDRSSPSEVLQFAHDGSAYAYAYQLTDRLGDAGIIAVLLATCPDGVVEIKSWVMSCRVFTRGVEWAIAEHFGEWFGKCGARLVSGRYVRGPRNAIVADLLEHLGLVAVETTEDEVRYEGTDVLPPAHHLRIIEG